MARAAAPARADKPGPKWEKPDPALVARFDACLPPAPGVDRRQMFGCPCAFTGGNMFAGLHEQRLILRLPEARRRQLLAQGTATPFAPMGRAMHEYVAVADALARPQDDIAALLEEARAFAGSLPPKAAKGKGKP